MTHSRPQDANPVPQDRASPSITERLARWISRLRFEDMPTEVVTHTKLCIIDSIGCGIYGAIQPWGRIAADVAVSFSAGGSSSLFRSREKAGPADASLANGTAIHGFEIDDVHTASSLHPGCVTIPPALAIAEALIASGQPVSGKDLLVAIASGYETGCRTGICAGISHSTSGFHVTGTVGSVAAAAASARMLGLSAEQATHAIGIGATQACGLYVARKGAMAKRFHAGRASQSGVIAAYLAAGGFTGSTEALEADFGGFMSTLHGQSDPATILEGLGSHWEILRVGFKAYASCASAHTSVDALDRLMSQGLTADNLERLTIRATRKTALNIGWPYQPKGITAAQMNGYYTCAVKLLDGEAFVDQYTEDRLADPAILAIIPKIEIIHDPELDLCGAARRHAIKATALLKDGRKLSIAVDQRKGSSQYPFSQTEVERKFRRLASVSLAQAETDQLIDWLMHLESAEDVGHLRSLLHQEE